MKMQRKKISLKCFFFNVSPSRKIKILFFSNQLTSGLLLKFQSIYINYSFVSKFYYFETLNWSVTENSGVYTGISENYYLSP